MEFGVLGPLQVNDRDVDLPGKQRTVLASLLLHANQVVPVPALIEALWDDAPPPSARTTLQGYIKQLRQNGDAKIGERLLTRPAGYLIRVEADELDLHRFSWLCEQARMAAAREDWHGAAEQFEQALTLWRGTPLADVPSALLKRAEVPHLAELRMRAVESRVAAKLRLGQHGELVAELRRLVAVEPLREGLHGQLMLALYGCGRQAEALEVFRGIDRRLRDELGISAGPELSALHQRILAADPALSGAQALVAYREPAPAVGVPLAGGPADPAQLPADAADFTGRHSQVELMCALLGAEPDAGRPGAMIVSAVAGMGGVGKTALAVHVAHRVRRRFPDGQLYVSLQGATMPLLPTEVLARLLRDLGEPEETIPAGEAARAARYRSLLARRRVLVVLDDAQDAAQVRPLLPGSADCAVIVTSRTMLTGLSGATQLNLDVLDASEARDLFDAIVGASRSAAEPEATAAVLESCAGLPLAIRIAGIRLASRPAWTIAHLAAGLADECGRLAELAAGDLAVRASFAVSYHALTADGPGQDPGGPDGADPARVFRLLGLPHMAELSLPAISVLAGEPPARARAALETLTNACLLQSPTPDRYRMHDLLRSYAAELAGNIDSIEERTAVERILHWYAAQAAAAARLLAPAVRPPRVLEVIAAPDQPVCDPVSAFGWFDVELANLVAAARQAAGLSRHDIAAQISLALREFLHRTPYVDTWLVVSRLGVDSARLLGDDSVLGYLLISQGQAHNEMNAFADADRCFTEALQIRRRTGERGGEAMAFNCLGINRYCQEKREQALQHMRSALDILDTVDDRPLTGMVHNNMGHILRSMKRFDEALDHLQRSLEIQRDSGDGFRSGITEITFGQTCLDLGRYEEAVQYCRRALATLDGIALGNRNRANALSCLGEALTHLGHTGEAREAWLAALVILQRLSDPEADEVRDRLAALP